MWKAIIAGLVFGLLIGVLRMMKRRKPRLTLADAIARLDLSEQDARDIKKLSYREVAIAKRNGGQRILQIPDSTTKQIQRRILRRILAKARCHKSAVGFEAGRSIVHAARPHVHKAVVIRIDISNFFPSTTAERVKEWFRRSGWDEQAAEFLTRCVTHNGALPQGAPTSPRLSNLVNARMDGSFRHLAKRFSGDYTRYADDITLSFNTLTGRNVRGILQVCRRILKRHGYRMNGKKTRVLRAHQRQEVVGLTVNRKVAIPRHIRRRLRAARHQMRVLGECSMTPAQLDGWSSFEDMVKKQR